MTGKQTCTKKWMALLLALCICILGIAGNSVAASAAARTAVSSLKLSVGSRNVTKKTYSMDVNEKASVKVTAKPSAAGKNAVFKSSNSAVASVSKKGVVTARKAGAANITVTVSSKRYQRKTTWVTIYVRPEASKTPDTDTPGSGNPDSSLHIKEQGIFSAGGTIITADGTFDPADQWEETGAGQTLHADHANVLYQIPENETGLPMVFLHGYGQSRMGWMTTPDGREGWSDLFLKKGHSVFLIDQPRRGEAGSSTVSGTISTKPLEQRWYTQFRIGKWENGKSNPNEGSQFPNSDQAVDQFFRQMTPDTGMSSDMGSDFDNETVAKAVAAAIDEAYSRTGKNSILVTHSQGGGPGWTAARYTQHIAAIIAIEPGGAPDAQSEDFQAVLAQKIPVTFYFGDYIDNGDPAIQATGMWQMMRQACYSFSENYNAGGGNSTVIDLPKIGITGNDHFLFQDLNNDVIADHVENWIQGNVSTDANSGSNASAGSNSGSNNNPGNNPGSSNNTGNNSGSGTAASNKILVAYFYWSGTSQKQAEAVAAQTGGELYRIERETPYSTDYNTVAYGEAKDEADANARPPLKNPLSSVSDYNKIVLCYPIWWHTAPMVVGTFLERYDWSGKTIYPISQSASMSVSQYEESLAFIRGCARNAVVDAGLFSRNDSDVTAYVSGTVLGNR